MTAKKIISLLLVSLLIATMIVPCASALDTEMRDLDIVVVIDTSGSMRYSDPNRISAAALKMLTNMMPAENSNIGIVTFNTEATVLTRDGGNRPALISLSEIDNVRYVKSRADSIIFTGDTGIGNALKTAADLLAGSSTSEHKKEIILFTDGMDDLPTKEQLVTCLENEESAISWCDNNSCPIYCVGFDYITATGVSSMGQSGEGIKKLNSYSEETGGYTKATSDINEIEQLFIDMLANICSLYYVNVATIPGDGGRHEKLIEINPNVIEANIRISSKTTNAVNSGSIELVNPKGQKVELSNHDNIRYDVDASAASIKILQPDNGNWLLVINGVYGDDVKIGLLEHYNIDIVSEISYNGKSEDMVCAGDKLSITTKILDRGRVIDDAAIYDIVSSAKILIHCDGGEREFEMHRDGNSFVGDFFVNSPGTYDVTVAVDSRSFHRENMLSVVFGERPPKGVVLIEKIGDVSVKKGETISVPNILEHVADAENQNFWIEDVCSESNEIASAVYDSDNDTIAITGKSFGKVKVSIDFNDDNGTKSTVSFNVKVIDFAAIALRCFLGLIVVLFSLFIIKYIRKKGCRIKGRLELDKIEIHDDMDILILAQRNEYEEIDEKYSIGLNIRTKNIKNVLGAIAEAFEYSTILNEAEFFKYINGSREEQCLNGIMAAAENVIIDGTYKGKSGIEVRFRNKMGKLYINAMNKGKLKITGGMPFFVEYREDNEEKRPVLIIEAEYKNGFKPSGKRSRKKKKTRRSGTVRKSEDAYGATDDANIFDVD